MPKAARLAGVLVEAVCYEDGRRSAHGPLEDIVADWRARGTGFVWAGLHDPEPGEVSQVAEVFALHPLAAEDALRSHQRPKAERYGEWLFVVLRAARYLDGPEDIDVGEIQLFASAGAIVVIRRGEPVPLAGVRARLEANPEALTAGPVAVLHAVIDEVVDAYGVCLEGLDDDVNEVERDVFADHSAHADSAVIERIYFLQREILELHRCVHPLAANFSLVRNDRLVTAAGGWDAYFRDVLDHLSRQQDQLGALRDLLAAALAAHGAQISLRQNEDMRRISAWVAIVAVPTMIAGIYGMNFENMPELAWDVGYPVSLGVMAVVCLTLWRWFRKNGWL